jgi:hypothetical protein
MPDLEVPYEVRQFIAKHLESMEQVEVLLLLARNAPRSWSVSDVAAELRWPQRAAQQCLEELSRGSLVRRAGSGAGGTYEYAPTPADRESIATLMQMYDTRPLLLGRLIYDRPPTVARSFADAFRIRHKRGE